MDSDHQLSILENLEALNRQMALQNSLRRIFLVGIIYGIGFFMGSVILATIAFGIFGPWFGQIGWVRDAFVEGSALRR